MSLPSRGRERHLAVTVVPLPGPAGAAPGGIVLLDDLTPLMRAQKVAAWGEVARKLAHEIKNPLTPIQLSAQRIRKAYVKSSPEFERVMAECTTAIVEEVEALKNLVDEFAQFARLPAVNLVPASLHEVIEQTLSLYDGLFTEIVFERRLAPDLPKVRLDPEQMKRVVINLVDNAIEATDKKGRVTISTAFDRPMGRVTLGVADDGPGIARRGPGSALRAQLLDEEARERPRPRHRQQDRGRAPRRHPRGGQRPQRRPVRRGPSGGVR